MDSGRQVMRWSIPGLIFLLVFLGLHVAHLSMFTLKPPSTWLKAVNAAGLVAAIAGGIPLGFIVYQFYYATYRSHVGWSISKKFPWGFNNFIWALRTDRGAVILQTFLQHGGPREFLEHVAGPTNQTVLIERIKAYGSQVKQGWPPLRLLGLTGHICSQPKTPSWRRCKECCDAYELHFIDHWTLFQAIVDIVSGSAQHAVLKAEYTSGSDLYHALGASRRAVTLAASGVVLYTFATSKLFASAPVVDAWTWTRWVGLVGAVWAVIWLALTTCRRKVDENYTRRIATYLAVVTRETPKGPWFGLREANRTRLNRPLSPRVRPF